MAWSGFIAAEEVGKRCLGRGVIDVWFVEDGRERVIFAENSPPGDVDIRRLP